MEHGLRKVIMSYLTEKWEALMEPEIQNSLAIHSRQLIHAALRRKCKIEHRFRFSPVNNNNGLTQQSQ